MAIHAIRRPSGEGKRYVHTMTESKTFTFPWQYRWIIIPLIMLGATYGVWRCYHLTVELLSGEKWAALALAYHLPVLFIGVLLWFKFFTMPFVVEIKMDGWITVRCILYTRKIAVSEITRIERKMFSAKVYHRDGAIYISNLINRISEIVSTLKTFNPKILTKEST